MPDIEYYTGAYTGEQIDDAIGKALTLDAVQSSIAIVADGDTHIAITSGQYVYVKGNTHSLADGLYKASTNISANANITSSNVSAVNNGAANALKSELSHQPWSETKLFETKTTLSESQDVQVTLSDSFLNYSVLQMRFNSTSDAQAAKRMILLVSAASLANNGWYAIANDDARGAVRLGYINISTPTLLRFRGYAGGFSTLIVDNIVGLK